jgi:CRP/FNR family cyclic AMP-dependent transcriptional regulator
VHKEFVRLFKDLLLAEKDVSRLSTLRRSASLFSQGDRADAIFYIEEGLVKLTRTNSSGGRLILSVYGPGDLMGEESLSGGESQYHAEAEALSPSTVYKVPWVAIRRVIAVHPELSAALLRHLVDINLFFAHKVELLCLHDVETRILFYLEQLSKLVKPGEDELSYSLPITQLELADLVGATRETVSTSLNQLERRGLVKLSRRLLTVYPRDSSATVIASGANA